ncbi:ATP-binding protein [Streptomyces sp. NPDC002104]
MNAPSGAPRTFARTFTQRFSSTPRGARLARQLALVELHDWGIPDRTRLSEDAGLLIAELTANAVTHGRIPGRDFELHLHLLPEGPLPDAPSPGILRIEVSDARRDRRPALRPHAHTHTHTSEAGYGMRIVEAVAADWGARDRLVGKTVWAELRLR